jgi:hypothetical protein
VTFVGITAGLFVAFAFGYFLSALSLPVQFRRPFASVFAPAVGLGFCSLLFYIFRRPMFTVEFALLLVPMCAVWGWRQSWRKLAAFDWSWRAPLLGLILASAVTVAVTGFLSEVDHLPHGDVDGWAIWNTHARLLHRAGPNWKSILPYTFHGDYPLLTSAVAARFWRYAGAEVPEAGAFLGIMLSLSGVALLGVTLRELRDGRIAALFAFVLLGTPYYLTLAGDQFADVPLSFFILATVALLVMHFEREPAGSGLLVLAGFTAGLAGWTKNEGLVFVLVALAVLFVPLLLTRTKSVHQFVSFSVGALFPLLIILFFKLTQARQNDLIESSNYQTLQGMLNVERHIMIVKYVAASFWTFGAWAIAPLIPLFAFVGLRGPDRIMVRSYGWLTGAAILAIMTAAYYFVYLITPLDLQYHLKSSLDRLMIHLWPSFLLLLGLAARPCEAPARQGEA